MSDSIQIENTTSLQNPEIVYMDEFLLVLQKPAQYYVHPPENKFAKQKVGRNTCLHWLKDKHNINAAPIHRLDYSTEGLVLFGIKQNVIQILNQQMRDKQMFKSYDAIVRGWFKEEYGEIDLPLESDSSHNLLECRTLYSTLSKIELNYSVHSNHPTTRYSWLDIELKTGRWHQIRRHMNRMSHPIIGDREHGDSHHNRFFRDHLKIDGLCLRAKRLRFNHPVENRIIDLTTLPSKKWNSLELIFQSHKV